MKTHNGWRLSTGSYYVVDKEENFVKVRDVLSYVMALEKQLLKYGHTPKGCGNELS